MQGRWSRPRRIVGSSLGVNGGQLHDHGCREMFGRLGSETRAREAALPRAIVSTSIVPYPEAGGTDSRSAQSSRTGSLWGRSCFLQKSPRVTSGLRTQSVLFTVLSKRTDLGAALTIGEETGYQQNLPGAEVLFRRRTDCGERRSSPHERRMISNLDDA